MISGSIAPSTLTFTYQQFGGAPPCQQILIPYTGTFTITPTGGPLFLYTSGRGDQRPRLGAGLRGRRRAQSRFVHQLGEPRLPDAGHLAIGQRQPHGLQRPGPLRRSQQLDGHR